ncbi:MAG: RRXRR domain-containing protein [Acidimicrobiales bacterium]
MSTLHVSEKTNQGMLPQSPALESTSADKPGVGTKRGVETRSQDRVAGVQLGRGEIPAGLTTNRQERHPSSSEQSGGEEDRGFTAPPSISTSRVFVLDMHGHPLMPCRPARARKLLSSGRARPHRVNHSALKDGACSEVFSLQARSDRAG